MSLLMENAQAMVENAVKALQENKNNDYSMAMFFLSVQVDLMTSRQKQLFKTWLNIERDKNPIPNNDKYLAIFDVC